VVVGAKEVEDALAEGFIPAAGSSEEEIAFGGREVDGLGEDPFFEI